MSFIMLHLHALAEAKKLVALIKGVELVLCRPNHSSKECCPKNHFWWCRDWLKIRCYKVPYHIYNHW